VKTNDLDEEIRIDVEFLDKGKSRKGTWNYDQLKLLGVETPLKKGWYKRLLGIKISKEKAEKFICLKDAHLGGTLGNQIEVTFCPHCGERL
jgi:hypothetical protein